MENTNGKYPLTTKRENVPMAHLVETPDDISFKITDPVKKIASSTEKKELINDFACLRMGLEELAHHFKVSPGTVDSVKKKKAVVNGRFVGRAYIDVPAYGRKLVRDKLPGDGILGRNEKDEYVELLKKKLAEETKELIEANGQRNRIEEMGDVAEVTQTLFEVLNISEKEVGHRVEAIKIQQQRERRKLK